MKILLINPNTSVSVTDRLVAAASAVAAPGTQILPLTAPRGLPYIASRAEAAIAAVVVLDMLAEHWRTADAAIIGAFGDPGLGGARELFPIPVVGLAEAAMLTACMLGRRFAIVSFTEALGAWYRETVEHHGLLGRLAGIRLFDGQLRQHRQRAGGKGGCAGRARPAQHHRGRGGRDRAGGGAAGRAGGGWCATAYRCPWWTARRRR